MDRRSFLTLVGLGAVGGAGTGVAWRGRDRRQQPEADPVERVVATSTGQQRITWSVETMLPVAGLTFDDGPDPAFTPRILKILERYGVDATFFVLGHNAAQHPELLQEVVAAGHEVGSHGWRHLNLAELSPAGTRREIEHGTRLVEEHAGVPVRGFRPPYGRFNETAVRFLAERRQDMYVWSVTRGGLAWQDPGHVASHVKQNTHLGDIIGLHDGIGRGTFNRDADFARRLIRRRTVEIEALPRILEDARERGLRLTTVSDLVRKARRPEVW